MKTNSAITSESAAIRDRIEQARRLCRLTIADIAREAGMYNPTVSHQLKGVYNIDIRVVLAVAKLCPNISAEWILRGRGDIIKGDVSLESRVTKLEKLVNEKMIAKV